MTLAVAGDEVARVQDILDRRWRASLEGGQEVAADIVLDFDAAEMTCPACLTTFPTGPKECPECGLFIG